MVVNPTTIRSWPQWPILHNTLCFKIPVYWKYRIKYKLKQGQRKAWHIPSPENLTRWPWPLTLKIIRGPDSLKGILSTSCVIFSYPKLLSISVLTFIKWSLNTELLMNTLRNVVFSTIKADHRYRKLINYVLTWARPTLFIYFYVSSPDAAAWILR